MENKTKIMLGLILLLVILNTDLLIRVNKVKAEVKTENTVESQDINILNHNMLLQQYSESESCQGILLKDPVTKLDISFDALVSDTCPVLFFRFKENTCDVCIRGALEILKQYSGLFPEAGLVVLSGYRNVRHFYSFFQSSDIHFRVLNVDQLPLATEGQGEPYFFVVTSDMKIQNVFITSREVASLTGEYLHGMGHKYWASYLHELGHTHEHESESEHDHEHN
jgi:hypothetical protein